MGCCRLVGKVFLEKDYKEEPRHESWRKWNITSILQSDGQTLPVITGLGVICRSQRSQIATGLIAKWMLISHLSISFPRAGVFRPHFLATACETVSVAHVDLCIVLKRYRS